MPMPPGYRRLSPGMYRAPDGALMQRGDGGGFSVSPRSAIQPGRVGIPEKSPPVKIGVPRSAPKPFYQKPMLPPPQGGLQPMIQGFKSSPDSYQRSDQLHSGGGFGSAARGDYCHQAPQFDLSGDPNYPRWLQSQGGNPQMQFQGQIQDGLGRVGQAPQWSTQGQPQQGYMQNYSELAGALRGNKPY